MHHGKRRVSSQPTRTTTVVGSRQSSGTTHVELVGRFRFQSKRPLCLQYNLPSSATNKKTIAYKNRRNTVPFYWQIIQKVFNFCEWLIKTTQTILLDFLLQPAPLPLPPISGYRHPESVMECEQPIYTSLTIEQTKQLKRVSSLRNLRLQRLKANVTRSLPLTSSYAHSSIRVKPGSRNDGNDIRRSRYAPPGCSLICYR